MNSLANLPIKELKMLAREKKVYCKTNISLKQLEIKFTMSSASTTTLRPAPRLKKVCLCLPIDLTNAHLSTTKPKTCRPIPAPRPDATPFFDIPSTTI